MKTCTGCHESKALTEFYLSSRARDRKTQQCKACFAAYYKANSRRQKDTNHRARIRRRYDLSVAEYDALVVRGCSICGDTESRIIVDHCHSTNSVRGPLCDLCNWGLGSFRDRADLLRLAADYLEAHHPVA